MARDRWTLALILICLPILATVITAFRVRDLPKNQERSKLDSKKVQPCENCDVKVGKVLSAKVDSDKHSKLDELKKAVREKQQQINQKTSESKSAHKYDVRSDEDEDDDGDLDFLKVFFKTGFIEEKPRVSKLNKVNSDTKSESPRTKKDLKDEEDENDDDDDDEDDDDYDDDDDDDDESDTDNQKNSKILYKPSLKPKVTDKPSLKPKVTDKPTISIKTPQSKVINLEDIKKQESREKNDNDDDDYDDDQDDDDDEYDGLENIEELFKILDIKKKPKTKENQAHRENKSVQKDETFQNLKFTQETKKSENVSNYDDDDDDNYDDDDDNGDKIDLNVKNNKHSILMKREIKVESESISKQMKMPESTVKNSDINIKPIETKPEKKYTKVDGKTQDTKMTKTKKSEMNTEKPHENKEQVKVKEKIPEKNVIAPKKAVIEEQKDIKLTDAQSKSESLTKPKEVVKDKKPKSEDKEIKNSNEPVEIKEPQKLKEKPKLELQKENKNSSPSKKTIEPEKDSELKSEEIKHKSEEQKKKQEKEPKEDFDDIQDEYHAFKKLKEKKQEAEKAIESKHRDSESKKGKISTEKLFTAHDEKNEDYLKHVTDAFHRRNLLKSEFEDFYAFFPTFAPNFSRIHNPECRRHGLIVMRQLRGTKLWALNMLDSTAKIPSGVLQGNGIQLGDFDQCVGSRARVQLDTRSVVKVQGKYCLARIDVKAEHPELEGPVYFAQAKSLIRSKIDDPGHFVPRFSTLSWGVCVPSACKSEDVEVIIKDSIKHYQHTSGVVIRVRVDEEDCHIDDDEGWEEWLELPTVLTLCFYGVIILLVLVATIQDFLTRRQSDGAPGEGDEKAECDQKDDEEQGEEKKPSESFITSFSLYRSVDRLIAPGTTDEISCIHGIRGIATLALLVAHKFLPVAVMPYTNRIRVTEMASSPLWSWCRSGWIFTDCFLLLSGTLTAHRIASETDSGATRRLFSRYLRLTPALLAVVLFYAYIWDKLSTGPMWGTFVTKNAEVCQQGWWWNLLYVQNYFGFEDMCAPQTHQLALDMQLTILGGIVIWAVQSELGFMRLLLPSIHLVSAYLRYTTVKNHRLTLLAYHGVSVSQLYRTARLSYMSTLHRCSPYLIGISLGLALKKPSKHGKFLLILGWLTSSILWALVLWAGIDSGSLQYRYSATFAAQYAAIAPIASAMAIAWVIYAVQTGTSDYLSRLLCCRALVLISRLSYALYLTQFIIFITSIGTVKTSREFTLVSLVDVQEIMAIILVSTVLTLTFVIPMQNLHKVFTFKSKSEPEAEKKESESKTEEAETKEEEVKGEPQALVRRHLLAHREVLEEIPEMEVEYETQREKNEGLDEILEEEEEDATIGEDEEIQEDLDNDLEIIEEEEAGEDGDWIDRQRLRDRLNPGNDDRDLDEWEWTNGNGRTGAQYYRYAR